jgi:HrpA-like RNA helicase
MIDTGLNEELIHDEQTNTNLKKCGWISKPSSSSRQLKVFKTKSSRVFRFYSKTRFKNLLAQKVSEFLTHPLQEICLLSKQTIPFNTSITDLISKAVEFPPFLHLRNSINSLKQIDTLDTWEDMTDLGIHLINLPVDLKYSKAIIYSVLFKCLNPVLVVVAILSVGSPFENVLDTNKRIQCNRLKENLARDSQSDHVLLYKLFIVSFF